MCRLLSIALLWLCILTDVQAQQSSFYCCDFASEPSFQSEWTVVNANNDYSTWIYNDWIPGPDGELGCVNCGWSGFGNNDYLISQPFTLTAGPHYAVFYVRSIRPDTEETFELCYGPSDTDLTQMTVVKVDSIMSLTWRCKVVNFSIPSDGDYYLAFHSTSHGNNLFVDNVCFGEGSLDLSPRIVVKSLVLPDANCDLTESTPLGVVIANEGTDVSAEQTLAFSVDGSPYSEQTFTGEMPLESSRQVSFDARADLLDVGRHEISIISKNESSADTTIFSFRHIAPVTELPFYTNFSTGDDVSGTWTSRTNCWKYDAMAGAHVTDQLGAANAFYSACMHLTGDIRLKFAYASGGWMPNKHFTIKLGRAGEGFDEWPVVYEDSLVAIQPTETEVVVHIDREGDYSLALVADGTEKETGFFIFYLDVYAIQQTDLQLYAVSTPLVPYVPQSHYLAESSHGLKLVNHGQADISRFSASLSIGSQECFTQDYEQTISVGDTVMVNLRGKLPEAGIGEKVNALHFDVGTDGEAFPDDNHYNLPVVHLTDTVFATEMLPKFNYGVGSSSETFFGNVYTLTTRDTLTSISVGLAQDISYQQRNLGVALYKLCDDGLTVDRLLWQGVTERGADEGLRLFVPAPMILEPGSYFVEVHQFTWNNIGVGIDYDTDYKLFYQRIDQQLRPIAGGGALVVRANFAHGAEAWQRDAGIKGFTRPVNTSAVFDSQTTVAVVVRNYGCRAVEAMKVACTVGNDRQQQEVALLPFEEQTLSFTFDLSQPGSYEVTATTLLEGDEHPANDTATLTLVSEEILSPYVLDFEGCNDYDHGHDFNPRWWSTDRIDEGTDGWAFYQYELTGQSVGFIAFCPEKTIPAMDPESGCYPHGGRKLGIAYCTSKRGSNSDVWLVSPAMQLGRQPMLTFWVKGHKEEGWNKAERYRVLVSTTTDDFDSFVPVGGDREVAAGDWQQVSVDLQDYASQPVVYIALQYISRCLEGFYLLVDDIMVVSGQEDGITVVEDGRSGSSDYYDLQGRTIVGKPIKSGIYIRNGRKIMVR